MPPRRSCFILSSPGRTSWKPSFNATTAFLLQWPTRGGWVIQTKFQCHHGVPACPGLGPGLPQDLRFNATTAFLLWYRTEVRYQGYCFNATTAFLLNVFFVRVPRDCAVSMPPRRSCFCSNQGGIAWGLAFQCHHGVPASLGLDVLPYEKAVCFNATTAFLLPGSSPPPPPRGCGFNATTAFLLHKQPNRYCEFCHRFQCHHGVPASCL